MLVPLLVHGNITGQLPAAWSVTAGVVAQLLGGRNTGRNTDGNSDGNSDGTVGELRPGSRRMQGGSNVPRPQLDTFGRIKKAAGALPRPRESIAPAPLLPLRSMPLRHRWPPWAAPTPCAAPNRQTTGADSPSAADRRSGAVCRCAGDAPALHRSCTCTTAPCTTGPAPPPPVAPHPGRLSRHSAPVASPPRHSCLRIASPRRRWPRPQSTAGQAVKSPGNAIETP